MTIPAGLPEERRSARACPNNSPVGQRERRFRGEVPDVNCNGFIVRALPRLEKAIAGRLAEGVPIR
jgi:hypothetical protein